MNMKGSASSSSVISINLESLWGHLNFVIVICSYHGLGRNCDPSWFLFRLPIIRTGNFEQMEAPRIVRVRTLQMIFYSFNKVSWSMITLPTRPMYVLLKRAVGNSGSRLCPVKRHGRWHFSCRCHFRCEGISTFSTHFTYIMKLSNNLTKVVSILIESLHY